MQRSLGSSTISSCMKENTADLPVPESPVKIVILFVNSKSTKNEVWAVEKCSITLGLLYIAPPLLHHFVIIRYMFPVLIDQCNPAHLKGYHWIFTVYVALLIGIDHI